MYVRVYSRHSSVFLVRHKIGQIHHKLSYASQLSLIPNYVAVVCKQLVQHFYEFVTTWQCWTLDNGKLPFAPSLCTQQFIHQSLTLWFNELWCEGQLKWFLDFVCGVDFQRKDNSCSEAVHALRLDRLRLAPNVQPQKMAVDALHCWNGEKYNKIQLIWCCPSYKV